MATTASSDRGVRLQGEFDAEVWAREFVEAVEEYPGIPTDEATMLGWFANALMAGYDHGRADGRAERSGVEELMEAIRLTQEYVMLPPLDGWAWWDVYSEHRPEDAQRLRREWLQHVSEASDG